MNEQIAKELTAWVKSIKHTTHAVPVKVTLGQHVFYGTRYRQRFQYKAEMRAVTEGHKTTDDTYEEDRLLLLGNRPLKMKNRAHWCTEEFDGHEWYLSHWSTSDERNEYQPLGRCFGMAPWNDPSGGKIDRYEWKFKYPRIPFTVEEIQ